MRRGQGERRQESDISLGRARVPDAECRQVRRDDEEFAGLSLQSALQTSRRDVTAPAALILAPYVRLRPVNAG
jgi:hypothetical protein